MRPAVPPHVTLSISSTAYVCLPTCTISTAIDAQKLGLSPPVRISDIARLSFSVQAILLGHVGGAAG